ncbi:MAG: transcriptional repressor, partial [Anaerolineae bacterium]
MRVKPRLEELVITLRGKGYRLTPQRLAVLRVLAESGDHPSVEQIYGEVRRQYPMMSRATVYKTVEALKEMAQVLELEFSGASNRYDGRRAEPHP